MVGVERGTTDTDTERRTSDGRRNGAGAFAKLGRATDRLQFRGTVEGALKGKWRGPIEGRSEMEVGFWGLKG